MYFKRYDNFDQKDELIEQHNSKPGKRIKLAHNEFSHLSQKEIDAQLKGFKIDVSTIEKRGVGGAVGWSSFNGVKLSVPLNYYVPTTGYTPPASVGLLIFIFIVSSYFAFIHLFKPFMKDWTQRGFNTPVRNQNPCGDCWYFKIDFKYISFENNIKIAKTIGLSQLLLLLKDLFLSILELT